MSEMNSLRNLMDDIQRGADLMRPFFPDESDEELRQRGRAMLEARYRKGRWPTSEEAVAMMACREKLGLEV
jgi:hypothetical protein